MPQVPEASDGGPITGDTLKIRPWTKFPRRVGFALLCLAFGLQVLLGFSISWATPGIILLAVGGFACWLPYYFPEWFNIELTSTGFTSTYCGNRTAQNWSDIGPVTVDTYNVAYVRTTLNNAVSYQLTREAWEREPRRVPSTVLGWERHVRVHVPGMDAEWLAAEMNARRERALEEAGEGGEGTPTH